MSKETKIQPLSTAEDLKHEIPAFLHGSMISQLQEAKTLPPLQPILPDFIFEGDMSIIFGGPNAGKTTLITQILELIASGKIIGGFHSEIIKEPVVYLDLEMDSRKLAKRYEKNETEVYNFSEKIIRVFHNREFVGKLKAKEKIELAIDLMRQYDSRILVIDNFSAMGVEHEKSIDALELMRTFRQVTVQVNGTVIVAAHTPKRNGNEILQLKDLAGSAVISNFADSVVGIGQDIRKANRRYLKGFKNRDAEKKYCGPQVLECEISKAENGLVFFEQIGTSLESHMLISDQEAEKIQRNNDILQMKSEGLSLNEIADKMGMNRNTVNTIIRRTEK
jgi:DNA-binding NarL/FixJ family response regulator